MFMIKCILFVYTLTNQYFSLEAMMTDLIFANKASAEFKLRLCIWDILLKFQDKVRMMIVFFFKWTEILEPEAKPQALC